MDTIVIAVRSTNKAKIAAVHSVFNAAFSDSEILISSVDAASGIDAQPMNDEDSLTGARNRAAAALQATPEASYGVGLEGNVAEIAGHLLLHGWVVIIDTHDTEGIGHSGGVEIPHSIVERLRAGEELGPIVQELMQDGSNSIRHNQGTNGILTNGLYTRIDEFTHATQNALAPFVSPGFYK